MTNENNSISRLQHFQKCSKNEKYSLLVLEIFWSNYRAPIIPFNCTFFISVLPIFQVVKFPVSFIFIDSTFDPSEDLRGHSVDAEQSYTSDRLTF